MLIRTINSINSYWIAGGRRLVPAVAADGHANRRRYQSHDHYEHYLQHYQSLMQQ
jgi:hypothetical protein